jgi:hypothetical protein
VRRMSLPPYYPARITLVALSLSFWSLCWVWYWYTYLYACNRNACVDVNLYMPASLQISYLLNIALVVTIYLLSFSAAPKATFTLLWKLDSVFVSLLIREDNITSVTLLGFEGGRRRGMSITDNI